MTTEGQIVLFQFVQTDQSMGKLRPALVIRKLPGSFNDWLICMISSQLHQEIPELDEIVTDKDADFAGSGLKVPSLIRITRLAVVNENVLLGRVGQIDAIRLLRIRQRLIRWLQAT